MERQKITMGKINNYVECINMVYQSRNEKKGEVLRKMRVEYGADCKVVISYENGAWSEVAFHSYNYEEVRIWLDGYAAAL